MYGDIGKVDVLKKASASGSKKNSAVGSDGTADNYSGSDSKCGDDDGADGCDAKEEIEKKIMFESGTALGCETTRMVTFTCEWDSSGGFTVGAGAGSAATTTSTDGADTAPFGAGDAAAADTELAKYLKCSVKG